MRDDTNSISEPLAIKPLTRESRCDFEDAGPDNINDSGPSLLAFGRLPFIA